VKLRVLLRLIEIQRVLLRHRLDDYVRATHLYRPLRFLFFLSPGVWSERLRGVSRAERLRLALEELGPIFVKFGQAVSTRRDLLPADIADELAKLQDRVPPFPGALARESLERAYGRALSQVFSAFDETPLAAASIAQVHAARLPDGEEVVVKVLRPDMRAVIERDLEVLHALADLAQRYWAEGRRLRPRELVAEYHKTILDELDLMREAANASQLKRNFAASELLYVPEVHWDYCRTDVMVMERIHGVPISERSTLLNVEGLGRELYPELDVWSTASPILREWMRERSSVRALVHELRTRAPELIAAARGLPALLHELTQRPPGGARAPTPAQEIGELLDELRAARRRDTITLGVAYLGGGVFWLAVSHGHEWPGWALLAAGLGIIACGLRR